MYHLNQISEAALKLREVEEVKIETTATGGERKTIIRRQVAPTWQASAWLLERLYPQEFGRRSQVELNQHSEAKPVKIEFVESGETRSEAQGK